MHSTLTYSLVLVAWHPAYIPHWGRTEEARVQPLTNWKSRMMKGARLESEISFLKIWIARWCWTTYLALKFLHCLLSFSALGVAYEGNPMWAQEVGHRLVKASLRVSSGMWHTIHIVYHISEKNIFKVLKKSNNIWPKGSSMHIGTSSFSKDA